MEERKDPLKGLDLPVPKPATMKLKVAAKTSIDIDTLKVVNECFTAIKDYHLSNIVEKAKKLGYQKLEPQEKELLRSGIIKLGEALTFCRDERNNTLARTGIIDFAKRCANARNHFIHHECYHTHLGRYDVTQECIINLPRLEELEERLIKLRGCGLSRLSKPIRKGENNFPFKYSHFVVCLNLEFDELKRILEIPDVVKKVDTDLIVKAGMNNHIRNILAIMVDLTDIELMSKNKDHYSADQKKITGRINREFWEKFEQFAELFLNYKEFRNSLCHLDETLKKPYSNSSQMLEFGQHLQMMQELGYVKQLQEEFIQKQEKEVMGQPVDKKEGAKRDAEELKISIPVAASSEKSESVKKAKEDPEAKQEKKKEVSEPSKSISEYGDDESPPPTGAPGMGRGKT